MSPFSHSILNIDCDNNVKCSKYVNHIPIQEKLVFRLLEYY